MQNEELLELASPEELAEIGGFDAPTPQEAAHLLRELDWDGRFTGMDVNAAAGESTVHLYSLKELAKFFRFGTAGLGFSVGGSGSVSVADTDYVINWINDQVGDTVLAKLLRAEVDSEDSYHDCARIISRLVNMRAVQLQGIADRT